MAFADDLKAFSEKAAANAHAVVRTVVIEVDRSLVEKSPVGNPDLWAANSGAFDLQKKYGIKAKIKAPPGYVGGRFRANWQYGENAIPTGELYVPIVGPFPNASESVASVADKVGREASGKIHYLVNNLPYAQAIEDGHSPKQAPAGVVGITILEFETIVETAVKQNVS